METVERDLVARFEQNLQDGQPLLEEAVSEFRGRVEDAAARADREKLSSGDEGTIGWKLDWQVVQDAAASSRVRFRRALIRDLGMARNGWPLPLGFEEKLVDPAKLGPPSVLLVLRTRRVALVSGISAVIAMLISSLLPWARTEASFAATLFFGGLGAAIGVVVARSSARRPIVEANDKRAAIDACVRRFREDLKCDLQAIALFRAVPANSQVDPPPDLEMLRTVKIKVCQALRYSDTMDLRAALYGLALDLDVVIPPPQEVPASSFRWHDDMSHSYVKKGIINTGDLVRAISEPVLEEDAKGETIVVKMGEVIRVNK